MKMSDLDSLRLRLQNYPLRNIAASFAARQDLLHDLFDDSIPHEPDYRPPNRSIITSGVFVRLLPPPILQELRLCTQHEGKIPSRDRPKTGVIFEVKALANLSCRIGALWAIRDSSWRVDEFLHDELFAVLENLHRENPSMPFHHCGLRLASIDRRYSDEPLTLADGVRACVEILDLLHRWRPASTRSTTASQEASRRMTKAELLGSHLHQTQNGPTVHVWLRDGVFIARGSHEGKRFGESLGREIGQAASRLRGILHELESGVYRRPSDPRRNAIVRTGEQAPTLRSLVDDFLDRKRHERGEQTAQDYRNRLRPALHFAELPEWKRRWPLARDINDEFVAELRKWLPTHEITRNGRSNGRKRPMSLDRVRKCLATLSAVLNWARDPLVGKLPNDPRIRVAGEFIPQKVAKDPLRRNPLSLAQRTKVVAELDAWGLCHLAWFLVLPMRPDEAAGLLIGDLDRERRELRFGANLPEVNFTKGRTSFVLPYPPQFDAIVTTLIANRREGPLLQSRRDFERGRADAWTNLEALQRDLDEALISEGERALTDNDRKRIFRELLRRSGGVNEDRLNVEFKEAAKRANLPNGVTIRTLRHATTQSLRDSGAPHLELRYLTGHSVNDIINVYSGMNIEPVMTAYFETIQPLLDAIATRANTLGLSETIVSDEAKQ